MTEFENISLETKRWGREHVTPDELGVALAFNSERTKMHSYTTPDGKQRFNVAEIDGRALNSNGEREGPDCVAATSWDYRIDDLYLAKMAIYAKQSGVRIYAAELPGVTINHADPFNNDGANMTPKQSFEALKGNFGPLVKTQFEAIREVASFKEGQELQFFSESMAALVISSILQESARGEIMPFAATKVVFNEPVNSFGNRSFWHLLQLSRGLATIENTRRGEYIRENSAMGYPWAIPYEEVSSRTADIDAFVKKKQKLSVLLSGAGLRVGLDRLIADALDGKNPHHPLSKDTEFIMTRGVDSIATDRRAFIKFRERIFEAGMPVRLAEMTNGEKGSTTRIGHAALDSLGRMASISIHTA